MNIKTIARVPGFFLLSLVSGVVLLLGFVARVCVGLVMAPWAVRLDGKSPEAVGPRRTPEEVTQDYFRRRAEGGDRFVPWPRGER